MTSAASRHGGRARAPLLIVATPPPLGAREDAVARAGRHARSAAVRIAAEREGARRGLSDAALGAICEVIDQIAEAHELNLRHVSRMLERAEAMASSPLSH